MAFQQNRIVRFLMVISLVIFTIFIYASYYSSLTMSHPPTRIHSIAALLSTTKSNINMLNSNTNLYSNSNSNKSNNSNSKSDDKGNGGETGFVGSADLINTLNSYDKTQFALLNNVKKDSNYQEGYHIVNTNSDSASKFAYETADLKDVAAVQIGSPQANIQNLLKNADKILKNLTLTSVNTNTTVSVLQSKKQELSETIQSKNNNVDSQLPQSPSSTAIRISPQQQQQIKLSAAASSSGILANPNSVNLTNSSMHLDLSNGIPTRLLYETGHLDVNPNLCPNEGDQIRLLIVITSAPTHRDSRLAIRQTWGHYGQRRDIIICFILGRTLNPIIEESLNNENYMYGDLIRGHFIDSYNNLTLKTISVLEWVEKQCPLINYVLKTDDDMFINVPKLLMFIEKQNLAKQNRNIIFGRLAKKWKPIRNKKSKYYVAPGQFSQAVFPQFTTGPAYLMSSDIIHNLYLKSLEQTYLKLEDVFTTGIVAQLLNIKRVHVNEFLNRRIAFNPCNIRKSISVHMIKSNEQFDLWKKLLDTSTKCK